MCADPLTLTLLSTGLQVFGSIAGGNAQADSDKRQAQQIGRQAALENERTAEEIRRERRDQKRLVGSQIANFSANGIQIDGSAADVIEDSAREADLDIEAIRFGNRTKQENFAFEQGQLRQRGRNSRRAGFVNAFSSLVSGGTKLQGAF